MVKITDMALLITFIGFHDSKVEGQTRIQKEICILKHRDSIPVSYDFKPYFYGPYSSELTDTVDTLVASGILEQTSVPKGFGVYRYDYSLTEQGKKLFDSLKETLEKDQPELISKLKKRAKRLESMEIPKIISLAKECSGIPSLKESPS